MKELIGKIIASRVQSDTVLGLGTGSTVDACLLAIGERIKKEQLVVYGVPSSTGTALLAASLGIRVLDSRAAVPIAWAFDGADEIDSGLNLIKGGGGAFFQEKVVAKRAGDIILVATEDKFVPKLGTKTAVPVEVAPEALSYVVTELQKLKAKEINLRTAKGFCGPLRTEQGNLILDVKFETVTQKTEQEINQIVGVLENGLFFGMVKEAVIARSDGAYLFDVCEGKLRERKLSEPIS